MWSGIAAPLSFGDKTMKLFQNKSAAMSLPKNKKVHGIEIKKVPVGKYIAAMREMEELPGIIVR